MSDNSGKYLSWEGMLMTNMSHALGHFIFKRQSWENMMPSAVLSIAPHCRWYDVVHDNLWGNDLKPMKIDKTLWNIGSKGSWILTGCLAFFSKFWCIKRQYRDEIEREI